MTTDSTELTFVRCPSCRSLVPAVSTRCRMCGAALDPSQRSEDSVFDQRKSGRVRQRTLSQPESDLSSAADQIRDEIVQEAPPGESKPVVHGIEAAGPSESEVDSDADPLSAYIEEIAVEENSGPADLAPPAVAEHGPAVEQGRQVVEASAYAPEAPVNGPSGSRDLTDGAQTMTGKREENDRQHTGREAETVAPVSSPGHGSEGTEQKARVIIETGGRRAGKGGLSFGKPREESRGPETTASGSSASHAGQPAQQSREGRFSRESRDTSQKPQKISPPPRREEGVHGKLCGWLVNYADPKGVAVELREGRFFMTRSSLKNSDLVVDDESVSTPHALICVSGPGETVRVQDLLSDRGVFMRRRNSDNFQRISDAVNLEHGDWVRFGEVEYLLCLVARAGSK